MTLFPKRLNGINPRLAWAAVGPPSDESVGREGGRKFLGTLYFLFIFFSAIPFWRLRLTRQGILFPSLGTGGHLCKIHTNVWTQPLGKCRPRIAALLSLSRPFDSLLDRNSLPVPYTEATWRGYLAVALSYIFSAFLFLWLTYIIDCFDHGVFHTRHSRPFEIRRDHNNRLSHTGHCDIIVEPHVPVANPDDLAQSVYGHHDHSDGLPNSCPSDATIYWLGDTKSLYQKLHVDQWVLYSDTDPTCVTDNHGSLGPSGSLARRPHKRRPLDLRLSDLLS